MAHGVTRRKSRPGLWLHFTAIAHLPDGRTLRRQILRRAVSPTVPTAEREAALLRQQVEAELVAGAAAERARGGPTWGQALDLYIADCRRRHTRLDRELYRLEILRRELGAHTPLVQVDAPLVLGWRDRQTHLSPASLNHYVALVVAVLNLAAARGLEVAPLRRGRRLPEPRQAVEWLTEEQVAVLLEVAATGPAPSPSQPEALPLHALVAIHYYTAARTSNCLELTWDQVDLEMATVTFPRTKNHRRVVCAVPPALVRILGALPGDRRGLVLGRRWRNYWYRWHRAIAAANVLLLDRGHPPIPPRARIYCLRHSRATHLARAGASVKGVADLLGDRVSMVERRYFGADLEGIRDALALAAASPTLSALERGPDTKRDTNAPESNRHPSLSAGVREASGEPDKPHDVN